VHSPQSEAGEEKKKEENWRPTVSIMKETIAAYDYSMKGKGEEEERSAH